MPEYLQFPLFVLAVLFFLGWFAAGIILNVRKGDTVLKWLRQGLPLIGERTTVTWRGSSVVEMQIAKAKNPFRSAETLVVFEPRDVPFLWAFARLQGRRDLLLFRGTLSKAPTFELEIFDPKGWTTHQTERDVLQKNWTRADMPDSPSLLAYYSGSAGGTAAKSLTDVAMRAGGKLVRLSVHRDLPNIEAHWLLPDPSAFSAHDLFLDLRQIGDQVMRG